MITFGEPDPRHVPSPKAPAMTKGVETSTAPLMLRLENEASHPEWDAFLAGVRGGDLTQTSWWARIKQASGFEVRRLVGRVDGEIAGGAQILARPLGPLGKAAYVPYGPIVVPGTPDEDIRRLAWHVRETCRRDRIRAAFVQPPEGGERVAAALRLQGFADSDAGIAPRASLRVDVTTDPPEMLARMVRHARAHVRRSLRDPLTVRSGSREDLALFHELHCCTAARHGFQPAVLPYLELLWDELRPSGLIDLLLVHTEGNYLAGLLLTRFGDGTTERISGYAPERVPRKKMRPNEALRWAAMVNGRENGEQWYDLGGVEYPIAEALAEGADPGAEAMRASRSAHKVGLGGTPLLYPPPLELFPNRVLRVAYPRGRRQRSRAPNAGVLASAMAVRVPGGTTRARYEVRCRRTRWWRGAFRRGRRDDAPSSLAGHESRGRSGCSGVGRLPRADTGRRPRAVVRVGTRQGNGGHARASGAASSRRRDRRWRASPDAAAAPAGLPRVRAVRTAACGRRVRRGRRALGPRTARALSRPGNKGDGRPAARRR